MNPSNDDVLILGGGVIGLSCALFRFSVVVSSA